MCWMYKWIWIYTDLRLWYKCCMWFICKHVFKYSRSSSYLNNQESGRPWHIHRISGFSFYIWRNNGMPGNLQHRCIPIYFKSKYVVYEWFGNRELSSDTLKFSLGWCLLVRCASSSLESNWLLHKNILTYSCLRLNVNYYSRANIYLWDYSGCKYKLFNIFWNAWVYIN
jgi:hypothetical protein